MAQKIQVPRELMTVFEELGIPTQAFVAIQHYFARLEVASEQTGSFKIVQVVTAGESTPGQNVDEIFVDTDTGEKKINLPKGPNGKSYRIVNVGSSGNNVILALLAGVKLFGTEQEEYLSDAEALIITFQTEQGWW